MKRFHSIVLSWVLIPGTYVQKTREVDSAIGENQDTLVIPRRHRPLPAKTSVFEVKVNSTMDMQRGLGKNLMHGLNSILNLNITSKTAMGKRGVSLFILDFPLY